MTLIFGCQFSKGVISHAMKEFFPNCQILTQLLPAKKRPKLGIHIPNAGDENQSCHILTVFLNLIEKLGILYYNIYIGTLIYTNATVATALQGVCVPYMSN